MQITAYGNMDRSKIPEYVEYYPHYLHGIEKFLNRSMIFIHPSLVEGFGSPPLEAMACGCAVVVSDSIGIREYAIDGFNCLMVPTRDSAALANAVLKILKDEKLRSTLIKNGIETAKRFTYDAMYKSFDSIVFP